MFKNKNENLNNLCGKKITKLRMTYSPDLSQRALAERLQLLGADMDKNAIQRIECGKRFVTDIELKVFAEFFNVSADYLLSEKD